MAVSEIEYGQTMHVNKNREDKQLEQIMLDNKNNIFYNNIQIIWLYILS